MSSISPTVIAGRVAPRPAARLTRRGRLVVVSALLAALGTLGGMVGHAATASAGERTTPRHVTVRPGETLWQLAERIASGGGVAAGQRLIVSGVSGR